MIRFNGAYLPDKTRRLTLNSERFVMEYQALERLLGRYQEALSTIRPNERYKWEAIACFKANWNPDADDFFGMLKASLASSWNLLSGGKYFPRGMLEIFAFNFPQETKHALLSLLDENSSLRGRLAAFEAAAHELLVKENERRQALGESAAKSAYQDPRAMSVYLTFAHPECHYLFKTSMFRKAGEMLSVSVPSDKFDRVIAYNKMCDEILAYVEENRPDVIQESDALLSPELKAVDPEHHLLVQDIVYFIDAYDDDYGWIPTLDDYDPGIESDGWLELLDNRQVFTPNALLMVKRMLDNGGQGSCKELSEKYGKSSNFYLNNGTTLGERLVKRAGVKQPNIGGWTTKWWMVPFIGKAAGQDNLGTFVWRLRPELQEALETYQLPNEQVGIEATMTPEKEINYPKNLILYGPPGTGKTYMTKAYAVAICEGKDVQDVLDEMSSDEGYAAVSARYQELKGKDRIGFVTFHQSYSYEEFIEGIRPEFDEEDGIMKYPIKRGAFLEFCGKASNPVSRVAVSRGVPHFEENPEPRVWKLGLSISEIDLFTYCKKHGCVRMGWEEWGPNEYQDANELSFANKKAISVFQDEMQPGDFFISPGNDIATYSVGVITGDFEWRDDFEYAKRYRTAQWISDVSKSAVRNLNDGKILTLQTAYELKRITVPALLDVMGMGEDAQHDIAIRQKEKPAVFIIDEINRGNVSKVFGELITLIEESKRRGEPEELSARLPYSGHSFSVPNNVYIIGTMNTADRSTALMDTALRRRFSFVEVMPKPDLLEGVYVGEVDVARMIGVMNDRIELLRDREHTLGHAYFMPLIDDPTIDCLAEIFQSKIIPLLQEYFYDDYAKIRSVLGAAADDFFATKSSKYVFWADDEESYNHLRSFSLKPTPKNTQAYKRIYQIEGEE